MLMPEPDQGVIDRRDEICRTLRQLAERAANFISTVDHTLIGFGHQHRSHPRMVGH